MIFAKVWRIKWRKSGNIRFALFSEKDMRQLMN